MQLTLSYGLIRRDGLAWNTQKPDIDTQSRTCQSMSQTALEEAFGWLSPSLVLGRWKSLAMEVTTKDIDWFIRVIKLSHQEREN